VLSPLSISRPAQSFRSARQRRLPPPSSRDGRTFLRRRRPRGLQHLQPSRWKPARSAAIPTSARATFSRPPCRQARRPSFLVLKQGSSKLFAARPRARSRRQSSSPRRARQAPGEVQARLTFELEKPDKIEEHKGPGASCNVTARPRSTRHLSDGPSTEVRHRLFRHPGQPPITVMAYQCGEFRSYGFSLRQPSGRLQYAVNAFQYGIYYYPTYYYDPLLWSRAPTATPWPLRKITGLTLSSVLPVRPLYAAGRRAGFLQLTRRTSTTPMP